MSAFASVIGWGFLPNLVTSSVQSVYYGITIRAGDPKPQPGSPRYNYHRRVIHILVVSLYLLYTIFEADYVVRKASHFYADLGVPISASERDVKSRFRRLAALHHPDKAGSDAANAAAQDYYIHLKTAAETLQDAARRFAYERFGREVVGWTKAVTIRDFVVRGVMHGILPHYVVAAASIYILGLFGYMEFGKFYRWLILGALCTFEVYAVTRPFFPPVVNAVNSVVTTLTSHPPYLPFQFITLARKITITCYIGLSQLGPLLKSYLQPAQRVAEDEDKALRQGLDRLDLISKSLDMEASRLVDMEMAPYRGDREAINILQSKMKEWLVQNTIRADPMVRDAVGNSFRKRRIDAPAGARGNR